MRRPTTLTESVIKLGGQRRLLPECCLANLECMSLKMQHVWKGAGLKGDASVKI
jgi:hypothetical protein